MATRLTELLGIRYPIIQGGMAWISDAGLAAAVSNAGGAGIISTGGRTTEYTEQEIRRCRTLTDKPFGVNVMLGSWLRTKRRLSRSSAGRSRLS